MIPRWLRVTLIVAVLASWVPLALVARRRSTPSTKPRVHLVRDMDQQPRFGAQQANALFADGRAMRLPVAGTVARGRLTAGEDFVAGRAGGGWAGRIPVPVTRDLMERGRERYGIHCEPCHGLSGKGDGMVARRAERLEEGAWVPPMSLHGEAVVARPAGHLFNTITNGIRTMPAYGSQVPPEDRWAIVAYVRALQRSQAARLDDVPPREREALAAAPGPAGVSP